ncbi:GntR family transcriptional regulator [Roseibium marinum]|uniref:GntR family histidine utilization transcriptional repressor n=1 Tax=Roseibium marinum TaxID=281252 RepID=A0A2S3UN11_9HYPH|nr:GntR family transcriptional regulator [Roseibium marinum]POF29108.1 GntR family histidine utilization transcriptional repressor [Roseibium marinum]
MREPDTKSWRGVQTELLRRINEREWTPGSLVPNEIELAQEFGCARTTVNRAMRELADAGLLDRRRKAGTRVALHPISRIVLDIPIIRLEVEQRNAEWRQNLLEKTSCVPPASITSRLGLDSKTTMLHVRSLHYADNHPFLHEDRWMNIDALPGVETVDFAAISANEWLIQNAPYTTGDIAFTAMNANKDIAEILEAVEGVAIFVVDRITWNKGEPITCVRLSYAPGYRMNTKI